MNKKEIGEGIAKLDRLLFGMPIRKQKTRRIKLSFAHIKNILRIVCKADLHLINNVIKANIQIGAKNVIKLLLIIIRVVDEMGNVNDACKKDGGVVA